MLQVPGGRKILDFQVALDRTGRWPCKVHHSHQKALVRACSYLWWMGWLYRILRSGWGASTEKCCGVMVGHTLLFQHHLAPTASDSCFHKQEDGLRAQCWDLLVLWHGWSTKACVRRSKGVRSGEKVQDWHEEFAVPANSGSLLQGETPCL